VGYNCRFLQGAESDPKEIYRLKVAIENGQRASAVIKNYRRDGTSFWNRIKIAPMVDQYGKVNPSPSKFEPFFSPAPLTSRPAPPCPYLRWC